MKIKDILRTNEQVFALEFFPPKNAEGREAFLKVADDLSALGPQVLSNRYGPCIEIPIGSLLDS